LFEVTKDPSSHPELHVFLQRIVGFDSVDDESTAERQMHHTPPPPYARRWVAKENPPYSYWYTFLSFKHRGKMTDHFYTPSQDLLHVREYGKSE
jgi:AMP deaminase